MPSINAKYDIRLSLILNYILHALHSPIKSVNLVNLPKKSQIIRKGLVKGLRHKEEIAKILLIKHNISKKIGGDIDNVMFDLAKDMKEKDYLSKYNDFIKNKIKLQKKSNLPFRDYLSHLYELEISGKHKSRSIGVSLEQQYIDDIERIRKNLLDNGLTLTELPTIGSVVTFVFYVGVCYYIDEIIDELYEDCKKAWLYNTSLKSGINIITTFLKQKWIFPETSIYNKKILMPFLEDIKKEMRNLKIKKK